MRTGEHKVTWDFACLRSPLLTLNTWTQWSNCGQGLALPERREALRAALRALVKQDLFAGALACASTNLLSDLELWERDPDSERGGKVERALVRYFMRACTRPTPFGLFAGVSFVEIGDQTRLRLRSSVEYRSQTQPSWELLWKYTEATAPSLGMSRRVRSNPTAHRAGGTLRYVRPAGEDFTLSELECDDYIDHVLMAASSPRALAELARELRKLDAELDDEDIGSFLHTLIEEGVLIDDTAPQGQGDRPLDGLIATLQEIPAGENLGLLSEALEALDRLPIGDQARARAQAQAQAEKIFSVQADARNFVTVLHKPADDATLSRRLLARVESGLALLQRLAQPKKNPRLDAFAQAFEQRFAEREVPLVLAADVVLGAVAEPSHTASPLLASIGLPSTTDSNGFAVSNLLGTWITRLHFDAIANGRQEICLTDDDIAEVASPPKSLPASFVACIRLVPRLDEEPDIVLHFAHGPCGTRLAGRFGHAVPELAEAMRKHALLEARDQEDVVLAEVNFSPRDRWGNITCHPRYYDYEILCFDRPAAPTQYQIPLDDLYLSRQNGQLVLRSARLGKRVLPRCSSAFTYSKNAFAPGWLLAALAHEGGTSTFTWDWLHLMDTSPFLPRVRYGKTILSLRRWNLHKAELAPFAALKHQEIADAGYALVQALRERFAWPRFLDLESAGDRTTIDLDNPLVVDTFIHLARTSERIHLEESLQTLCDGNEESVLTGPEGSFAHELLVTGRCPPEKKVGHVATRWPTPFVIPGGECLYLKVYARPPVQDQILYGLRDVITRAEEKCERWFFLRYGDPHAHLRLRFFGEQNFLSTELLPELHAVLAPWVASELVWRVQIDSYEQELSRYGGPDGLALAEEVFCLDSRAYMQALASGEPDTLLDMDDDVRLALSLRGLRDMLSATGWSHSEVIAFCERSRDDFLAEFGLSSPKGIAQQFRRRREDVECWLGDEGLPGPLLEAFDRRGAALPQVLQRISSGVQEGSITRPMPELVWSYNHMLVNRIMPAHARMWEMLTYDFLTRSLRTVASKKRATAR